MIRLYERENSPYWYAEISVGGASKRISTGVVRGSKTRAKALAAAEQRRQQLVADLGRRSSLTLQDLWLRWSAAKPGVKASTVDSYGSWIAYVIHHLKNPAISEITPGVVRQYVRDQRGAVSDLTLRMQLSCLSSILSWAIAQDLEGAPEANPVKLVKITHLARYDARPRWLKADELRRLWAVINDPEQNQSDIIRRLVPIWLGTGMRSDELLGLEWSEVDLQAGTISLKPAREKSSRGRVIPLTSTLVRTLEREKRYPGCPYVFVNPRTKTRYKCLRGVWVRIRRKAGVPHARIHDLRHTFATHLRHSGVPKEDRMSIMGHSSEDVHANYADTSLTVLRDHLEKHSPSTLLAHGTKD